MTKINKIPGASWPHKIDSEFPDLAELFKKYESSCLSHFGRICSLEPHLLSKKIYHLATNSSIINNVRKYIGQDINIWSSAFFIKKPQSSKFVGFHQDSPYWQLSSKNVVTAWIALLPSNIENGCLEFLEYSPINDYPIDVLNAYEAYQNGKKTTIEDDLISFKQNLPKEAFHKKKHYVELNPGEFSLHKIDVIHGSGRNKSCTSRVGLAVRYIDSDTVHLVDPDDSLMHVSGKVSSCMQCDPIPTGEFTAESIEHYQKAMKKASAFGNKTY